MFSTVIGKSKLDSCLFHRENVSETKDVDWPLEGDIDPLYNTELRPSRANCTVGVKKVGTTA